MRRFAYFLVTVFVGAATFYWSTHQWTARWEPMLRERLCQLAEKRLETPVKIGAIRYRVPLSFRIDNLDASPLVRADRITVSLSLINMPGAFARRAPERAIGFIQISRPQIRLDALEWGRLRAAGARTPAGASSSKRAASFSPPVFGIGWEDGEIVFASTRPAATRVTLQNVQGAFSWKGPQQRFLFEASSPLASHVGIRYSALGRRWRLKADTRGLDLRALLLLSREWKGRSVSTESLPEGTAELTLAASGSSKPRSPGAFLASVDTIDVDVRDGSWALGKDLSRWGASLHVRGEQGQFQLTKGRWSFGGLSGIISGKLSSPLTRPQASIQVRINPGQEGRLQIRDAQFQVNYAPGRIELTEGSVQLENGRLQSSGRVENNVVALQVLADNFDLAKFAEPSVHVDGRLSASARLEGPIDDWRVRASWWAAGVKLPGAPLQGSWRGTAEASADGAIAARGLASDGRLRFQTSARYAHRHLAVQDLLVTLDDRATIRASGDYRAEKREAEFRLTSSQLELSSTTLRDVELTGIWQPSSATLRLALRQESGKGGTPATIDGELNWQPKSWVVNRLRYTRGRVQVEAKGVVRPVGGRYTVDGAGFAVSDAKQQRPFPLQFEGDVSPRQNWRGRALIRSSPLLAEAKWDTPSSIDYALSLSSGGWNGLPLTLNATGYWRPGEDLPIYVTGRLGQEGNLEASVRWETDHLVVDQARYRTPEARLDIRQGGEVRFLPSGAVRTAFVTDVRNVKAGILRLFGRLQFQGEWTKQNEAPVVSATLYSDTLFINDYEMEKGQVRALWRNGRLEFSSPPKTAALISGAIDFSRRPQLRFENLRLVGREGQRLELDGEAGPRHWDFQMVGRSLDLATLGELGGLGIGISGSADLSLVGRGDPQNPYVQGSAQMRDGSAGGLRFSQGEADFIWQEDRMTFQALKLQDGRRYTLTGGGVLPLRKEASAGTSDQAMNVSFRLQDTTLGILQSAFPQIAYAKGTVEGLVQLQGTLREPTWRGRLTVEDGELRNAYYFRRLRNINVSVDFQDDTIVIREVRGRSGKGDLTGAGKLVFSGGSLSSYDVKVAIPDRPAEIEIPQLAIPDSPLAKKLKFFTSATRIDAKGSAHLHGNAESPLFEGEMTFTNGHFTYPPSGRRSRSSLTREWARQTLWDVALRFGDGVWFENELVQANVSGAIKLKGLGRDLIADGGFTIAQGRISYLGLQFDIREGRFDLKSNVPFMRTVADARVEAVDRAVAISGGSTTNQRYNVEDTITLSIDYAPLDQIKPRLTSANNPNLTQEKILARVTKLDVENLTPEERNYLLQKQFVSLVDNSLTTPFAQTILKRTGIADRIRVQHIFDPSAAPGTDPATGQAARSTTAADLFANTKYTVEKDLPGNVSIGYGIRFVPTEASAGTPGTAAATRSQQLDLISDLQLSYRAFKNIYIRGAVDLPNQGRPDNTLYQPDRRISVEPRWRFGWWGNTNKKTGPKAPKPD